ncbi:hypothetical protein EDD37DRAFT_147616 [Exophiala viscosa]|uniref:uncharacterized protein n=1 Tax=Exophiala viscosa TaxID=2486360 RepID=UPI00218EF8BD|nr:hypothetical protein EDD37DRAFT_147616 [Exophiala viscosa]
MVVAGMFAQRSPKWKWLTFATIASVFLLLIFHNLSWLPAPHDVMQHGLGWADDSRTLSEDGNEETFLDEFYQPPNIMPWNYTAAMVMARTKAADISWVEKEKLDLDKYIYVADDPTAPLHPPMNKGNEAMIYLTYIIDHYDSLRDFTLFVHAHRYSGHNNAFLGGDAVKMLRNLNAERIMHDGYMNLRCQQEPGCPSWVHPHEQGADKLAPIMLQEWNNLFPGEPVPEVLAQTCCAQFAVSRDRIRTVPLSKYEHWRNWLLETDLADYYSGRIFEYLWQVLFTGESIFCPDQLVCFCDGFGVCFEGLEDLEEYHKLGDQQWKTGARMDLLKKLKADHKDIEKDHVNRMEEWYKALQLEHDSYGKRRENITAIANRRGQDPKVRAEAARYRTIASSSRVRW